VDEKRGTGAQAAYLAGTVHALSPCLMFSSVTGVLACPRRMLCPCVLACCCSLLFVSCALLSLFH
jgi:hypothetical protein